MTALLAEWVKSWLNMIKKLIQFFLFVVSDEPRPLYHWPPLVYSLVRIKETNQRNTLSFRINDSAPSHRQSWMHTKAFHYLVVDHGGGVTVVSSRRTRTCDASSETRASFTSKVKSSIYNELQLQFKSISSNMYA